MSGGGHLANVVCWCIVGEQWHCQDLAQGDTKLHENNTYKIKYIYAMLQKPICFPFFSIK